MARKLFCGASICICLASLVVAVPSRTWSSSSWTTEPSQRSGWEKTEVSYESGWKRPAVDDSKGKGWVSSESADPSIPKSIPTSWQKVERHHGSSEKSGGWRSAEQKSAMNPPAQDIAQGIVVRHPVPAADKWSADAWDKQSAPVEYWSSDAAQKSAPSAGWEKAAADQWQQAQGQGQDQEQAHALAQAQAQQGSPTLDSSAGWDKSPSAQMPPTWTKDTPPSPWDKSGRSDRESAAGYAATGPAEHREDSIASWQEKSNTNAWQKDSSSVPAAWNNNPTKWDSQASNGNPDWHNDASSNGWDASPGYKAWQPDSNGWTTYDVTYEHRPVDNTWQKPPSSAPANAWQDNAVSNGWEKTVAAPANAWNKNTNKKSHG